MTVTSLPVGPAGPAALPARGPSRAQRFVTLMRREWLQHRIGWCVLLAAPSLLTLVLGLFDHSLIQVSLNDDDVAIPALAQAPAALQVMLLGIGITLGTLGLAVGAVGFQLPGLARRDAQDRSIEFWRSMPTSHGQSVAATLLMHALVLPWLALAVGALGSQLVALLMVASTHGLGAWFGLPWGRLLAGGGALVLRAAWGLPLALLWLSPLILLTLAASAWFKRWGVPVVVAAGLAGLKLIDPRLPQPWVRQSLDRLLDEAGHAMLRVSPLQGAQVATPEHLADWLPDLPGWALRDGAAALVPLASPAFVLALAVAAGGFALLVWRRRAH